MSLFLFPPYFKKNLFLGFVARKILSIEICLFKRILEIGHNDVVFKVGHVDVD